MVEASFPVKRGRKWISDILKESKYCQNIVYLIIQEVMGKENHEDKVCSGIPRLHSRIKILRGLRCFEGINKKLQQVKDTGTCCSDVLDFMNTI